MFHEKENEVFMMLPGTFMAKKKNGTIYYRSNITYRNKHISLGSFSTEEAAHSAYLEAQEILSNPSITLMDKLEHTDYLSFEKAISLFNFRDHQLYIKTPIYLHTNYFSYFLSPREEYKFDIDDLFFYSTHKISRRGGHLFVNEYGMQTNILSRYGIHNFSVPGRDYQFVNGDPFDYRYSNLFIINRYYGVFKTSDPTHPSYDVLIHIKGNYKVGRFHDEITAAIAYNKAVDYAISCGIQKNFPENYILDLSGSEYAAIYSKIKLSRNFINYCNSWITP